METFHGEKKKRRGEVRSRRSAYQLTLSLNHLNNLSTLSTPRMKEDQERRGEGEKKGRGKQLAVLHYFFLFPITFLHTFSSFPRCFAAAFPRWKFSMGGRMRGNKRRRRENGKESIGSSLSSFPLALRGVR